MKVDYAKEYGLLHESSKRFPGYAILPFVDDIRHIVADHFPSELLDYGSGKGYQYLAKKVHLGWGVAWGALLPTCYDPGVRELSQKPNRRFPGVICTDVMEHIDEEDLNEVLQEIASYVDHQADEPFVFFSVTCGPAGPHKKLSDGRNVHLTVKPPEWWTPVLVRWFSTNTVVHMRFQVGDRIFSDWRMGETKHAALD